MQEKRDQQQKGKPEQKKESTGKNLLRASTLGIELVFLIAFGLYIGYSLDTLFSTKPYLMILFFCIGIFAGFRNFVKTIRKMNEK